MKANKIERQVDVHQRSVLRLDTFNVRKKRAKMRTYGMSNFSCSDNQLVIMMVSLLLLLMASLIFASQEENDNEQQLATISKLLAKRSYPTIYSNEIDQANLRQRNKNKLSARTTAQTTATTNNANSDNNQRELVFSNSTGAIVQCAIAQELLQIIARADEQRKQSGSQATTGSLQQQQQQQIQVQVRWEKENGEEIEQTLYPTSTTSGFDQDAGSTINRRPLRYVRGTDGALVFEPFRASDFRPDVHAATYRCSAQVPSRGASLLGTDIRIRALVAGLQSSQSQSQSQTLIGQLNSSSSMIQVEVLDELVIEGSNALFRCQLPSYALDYLQVVEWVEYPSEISLTLQSTTLANAEVLLYASSSTNSNNNNNNVHTSPSTMNSNNTATRYYMSPKSGDLHIVNVDSSLNYRSFKCRCRNRLTGELISSINRGKLIVTESHTPVAPRLLPESTVPLSRAAYDEGELALLSCNAQAKPRAEVSWWLKRPQQVGAGSAELKPMSGELEPIAGGRHVQVANGLLLISRLSRNDSGTYLCLAKNSAGEERAEVELFVRAKLRAKLRASASVLELGKSLALDCSVSGYPIHQVVFRHNQNIIKSISGAQSRPESELTSGSGESQSSLSRAQQQQQHHYHPTHHYSNGRRAPSGSYFVVDSSSDELKLPSSSESAGNNNNNSPGNSNTETSNDDDNDDDQQQLSHVIVIVLEPQHAGAYQCFAYNQYESVQSSAYIRVLDDPPKFKDTFRAEVYEPRQDISLQCSARANPLPEITWLVDELPIPESARTRFGDFVTKDNLVISYVNISQTQPTDGGLYKCTADNGLAQISHQAQISISGPLQVKPMPNATVVASTSFRFRCPVAGYPVGEIQWQHNGRRLPANHRQHVYENGTLLVEHMEKSQQDDGEYVCLVSAPSASAGSGQSSGFLPAASGSLHLSIKARPTIEPFTISRSLREGQRASVTCTMSSGDLPITIQWFRNGQPLIPLDSSGETVLLGGAQQVDHFSQQASDYGVHQQPEMGANLSSNQLVGVRVSRVSDYASTLLFESLVAQHSANYTCLARNDAGSVSHEAPMVVQVAPKWSLEPSDTSIIRGTSVSVNCMAGGFPPPRIIWTKAAPDQTISSQTSRDLAPKSHHLGSWRAIVSSPHLQVYENGSLNILEARDSDAGHYMCQAINGVGPGLSKVIRITINVAAQFQARHSIQYVVKGEQTHLKCQAKGDWPVTIHWFKDRHRLEPINIQDSPPAPQQTGPNPSSQAQLQPTSVLSANTASILMVSGTGSGSIDSSNNNNNQASGYYYPSSSATNQPQNNKPSSRSGSYIEQQLNNLLVAQQSPSPATLHSVSSSTSGGLLLQRYSLSNTESAPSSANFNLELAKSNRPSLSRSSSSSSNGENNNANNLHQSANQMAEQTHEPVVVQVNSVLSINQAERLDTGTFKCIAANAYGLDERTIQLIVQEVPARIEELTVLDDPTSSRTITLGWLAPYDGNAPITNYHIQYRAVSSNHGGQTAIDLHQANGQMTPEMLNNLAWFNYTISAAQPDQQQSASNGQSIVGKATQSTSSVMQLNTGRNMVKIAINSLKPVTRYWFRVEAENKLGRGPTSRIIEAQTDEEAPSGAPSRVKAIAQSSSSILVSWARLSDKESLGQVRGYHVAYRPILNQDGLSGANSTTTMSTTASDELQQQQQQQQQVLPLTSTSVINTFKTIQHDEKLSKFDALITGLKRSTKYVITVQAFNIKGSGPATDPISVRTLDMDPPRQVKLFVKQATNCTIQLEWRPMSQAALAFSQTSSQTNKQSEQSGGQTVKSSQYSQSVALPLTAHQSVNEGMHLHAKNQQAAHEADVVDYYSLYQAEINDRPQWQEVRLPGHSSSYTVEGLACGARYQFYMMGVNKIGIGDQSDILDTRTIGGLPIAPDRQSAFDVINTTCYIIRLDHWQDNGCPIRDFNIRYRLDTKEWIQLAHFNLSPSIISAQESNNEKRTSDQSTVPSQRVKSLQDDQNWLPWSSESKRVRRSAIDRSEDVYIFNMEDGRDDEDSFLDYTSDMGSPNNERDFNMDEDYASEQSFNVRSNSNISSDDYNERQSDTKLFNLLKDSMLPTFDASAELVQDQRISKLPPMAQEWQASNFVESSSGDKVTKPIRVPNSEGQVDSSSASTRTAQVSSRTSGSSQQQQQYQADWRRVKFCNLVENIYYNIQITATNGVGDTEAELRLLTSQEGLEYDKEIKRQVVGKLEGNRMAQHGLSMGDRFNIFPLNQWPVLVPITLSLIIMTAIVIITLLIRRTNSSGSTSTTTTTTTTTMGSSSSASHCQNYLNESHAGHQHLNGMGTYKSHMGANGAPSAITEATMGSDMMIVGPGNLDSNNYATAKLAGVNDNYNHPIYQHRSNHSPMIDEPAYGVVGLAQLFNENNRSSSSPTTTGIAASLNSGSSSGPSVMGGQQCIVNGGSRMMAETMPRGRNVYLCSSSSINPKTDEIDLVNTKPEAIFYGINSATELQQQQQEQYDRQLRRYQRANSSGDGIAKDMDNYATSRQLFPPPSGADLCGVNQVSDLNAGRTGENETIDNCFMSIVEEVARANEDLRNQSMGQQQTDNKLIETGIDTTSLAQCQQADCINQFNQFQQQQAANNNNHMIQNYTQTVRALVDDSSRQQQLHSQLNVGNNNAPVANQLMFDPVYATIRRTFPQAFRYLTLQNQHHHHNNQNVNNGNNLQQQQQHQQLLNQNQIQQPATDIDFSNDGTNKMMFR